MYYFHFFGFLTSTYKKANWTILLTLIGKAFVNKKVQSMMKILVFRKT